MRSNKYLINYSCNPHNNMIGNHSRALGEKLYLPLSNSDRYIVLGYSNVEMEESKSVITLPFCDSFRSCIR